MLPENCSGGFFSFPITGTKIILRIVFVGQARDLRCHELPPNWKHFWFTCMTSKETIQLNDALGSYF